MRYLLFLSFVLFGLSSCAPKWNPKKYRLVEITDSGEIYSTLNLEKRNDNNVQVYRKRLLKRRWMPDSLFRTVSSSCVEGRWPAGIKTPQLRQENRLRMRQYKAYTVTKVKGKYILYVPKAANKDNKNLPNEMLPASDFFVIIGKSGIEKKDEYLAGYENWKRPPRKVRREQTRLDPKTAPGKSGATAPKTAPKVEPKPTNPPQDELKIRQR